MASSRETLSKPLAIRTERVDLPEFGPDEYVICHGMTAGESQRYEASLMKKDWTGLDRGKALSRQERMVMVCARDDNGARIFAASDLAVLQAWPSDALDRVYEVCSRLVKGGTPQTEEAENLAVKNSPEIDEDSPPID